MSIGVTKDYKLKVKNLHASHTLGLQDLCLKKRYRKNAKKKKGGKGRFL
jgi:hypothetical protein